MPNYPPVPSKLIPATGGAGESSGTTQGAPYFPPTPDRVSRPEESSGGGPTGNQGQGFNRQAFTKAYANLVARTWVDDQYLELLLANPVETLTRAGITSIPGAVIRIIQHRITGTGRIEDQVEDWIRGNQTGLYELWLPFKPEDVDLSGESGGALAVEESGGSCCCCSPCCCCT